MRIGEKYILREIEHKYLVFPIQKEKEKHAIMYTVNETGAILWNALQNEITEDELVYILTSKYDVDEKTARRDVKIFIRDLVDSKLIEKFP